MNRRSALIFVLTVFLLISCVGSREEQTEPVAEQNPDTGDNSQPLFTDLESLEPLPDEVTLDGGTMKLDLLGWSNSSTYLACGERGELLDPIDVASQGFARYRLVDVARDAFVSGVSDSIRFTESTPVFPRQIDSVRSVFAAEVRDYGVEGRLLGEKLVLTVRERSRERDVVRAQARSGRVFELVMRKEFLDNPEVYGPQGRYELTLTDELTGRSITLERAGEYYGAYAGRHGYYIHSAYLDPSDTYIAVFTLMVYYAFEGAAEPHFKVNTARLPR